MQAIGIDGQCLKKYLWIVLNGKKICLDSIKSL